MGQPNPAKTWTAGFKEDGGVAILANILVRAPVGHSPDECCFINNMGPGIDSAVDAAISSCG
jgi:hypothetical protein